MSKALSIASLLGAFLLVQSCDRGLTHSTLRDIESEKNELSASKRTLAEAEARLQAEIAGISADSSGVPGPRHWASRVASAKSKLESAERDERELARLARQNRAAEEPRVERLLAEERDLRRSALSEAKAVDSDVLKWRSFAARPGEAIAQMSEKLRSIESMDLQSISKTVEKAEKDWPAKKDDLERRLLSLKNIQSSAQATWDSLGTDVAPGTAGTLSGAQVGTLIAADDTLTRDVQALRSGTEEVGGLSGQLYNSWDKVLADLEISRFGNDNVYRERLKIVRAHFPDSAAKGSEVTSEERWVNVPEQTYRSLEGDIGMTIAHKDAGLYDSEARQSPQPPGFAYVAPVEAGSNQYGYWTHSGGQTFWSFLPQYLILRELLRSHDYRPIYLDEYRGYTAARAAGRTYYGGGSGAAAATRTPTYGTHGTFTAKNYANSRYVQSGGYRGSAYASSRDRTGFSSFRSSPSASSRPSFSPNNGSAGKRFGLGASPSSGRRFGRPGGIGRSFGRGRR